MDKEQFKGIWSGNLDSQEYIRINVKENIMCVNYILNEVKDTFEYSLVNNILFLNGKKHSVLNFENEILRFSKIDTLFSKDINPLFLINFKKHNKITH